MGYNNPMSQSLRIIRSAPGSAEALEAIMSAAEQLADLLLIDAGAAHVSKGALDGFCGTAFAAQEDIDALGIDPQRMEKGVRIISRAELLAMADAMK